MSPPSKPPQGTRAQLPAPSLLSQSLCLAAPSCAGTHSRTQQVFTEYHKFPVADCPFSNWMKEVKCGPLEIITRNVVTLGFKVAFVRIVNSLECHLVRDEFFSMFDFWKRWTTLQFNLISVTTKLSRFYCTLPVQSQEKVKSEDKTCSSLGQKAEVLPCVPGRLMCTVSQIMLTSFRCLKS